MKKYILILLLLFSCTDLLTNTIEYYSIHLEGNGWVLVDKGTEFGVVCRGCYEPIEGYMADGDDSQEEFENYIDNDSVLKRFRTFMNENFFNYEEWHEHMINKMGV